MAFLNNIALRPSCIVSALPKRFRVALEKDLAGSVAISTCQVEQLENAVKLRGATMAIVGASSESFEIAERLSHESQAKVFLVHYQDNLASKAMTNGFAGIFDLRVEQERFAEAIRQEALLPTRHLAPSAPKKPSQRRVLQHFITMSERLSTPQMVMELMLDGFLETAGAHSGVLLLPSDSSPQQFKIIASRGEDAPQITEQVTFTEDVTLEMLTGATLFFPEGISYSGDTSWSMGFDFSVGVPLVAGNELLGCLLAKTNEASDSLADYGLGAAHILSQLHHREGAGRRERIISLARQSVLPGWLLVTAEGRVVYREGNQTNLICNSASEITGARVKHALAEAQGGRSGSITYRDSLISYRPIRLSGDPYTLLSFGEKKSADEIGLAPGAINTEGFIDFIKSQLGDSAPKSEFIETILQDLSVEVEKRRAVNLKTLSSFGIQLVAGHDDIPTELTGGIALLLMTLARIMGDKIAFSFAHREKAWAITFEHEENTLHDGQMNEMSALPEHPLVKMVLQMAGFQTPKPCWRFGTYGGRLECRNR